VRISSLSLSLSKEIVMLALSLYKEIVMLEVGVSTLCAIIGVAARPRDSLQQ
jgi:hypothetical protein